MPNWNITGTVINELLPVITPITAVIKKIMISITSSRVVIGSRYIEFFARCKFTGNPIGVSGVSGKVISSGKMGSEKDKYARLLSLVSNEKH
jgi:hypothetical protein